MKNEHIIVGYLGDEPKKISGEGKQTMVKLSVATTKKWKDKETGEDCERTTWHQCICFRWLADDSLRYLKKGDKVCGFGEIQTDKYEKDGQVKYSTQTVLNDIFVAPANRQHGITREDLIEILNHKPEASSSSGASSPGASSPGASSPGASEETPTPSPGPGAGAAAQPRF